MDQKWYKLWSRACRLACIIGLLRVTGSLFYFALYADRLFELTEVILRLNISFNK